MEIKPPSPSTETQLAPLKVAKAKQSPVPLNIKPQHGSSSPREAGTPENSENGKQWARKVKVKTDPLSLSPVRFVAHDVDIKLFILQNGSKNYSSVIFQINVRFVV